MMIILAKNCKDFQLFLQHHSALRSLLSKKICAHRLSTKKVSKPSSVRRTAATLQLCSCNVSSQKFCFYLHVHAKQVISSRKAPQPLTRPECCLQQKEN
jgi:hypothetical protein